MCPVQHVLSARAKFCSSKHNLVSLYGLSFKILTNTLCYYTDTIAEQKQAAALQKKKAARLKEKHIAEKQNHYRPVNDVESEDNEDNSVVNPAMPGTVCLIVLSLSALTYINTDYFQAGCICYRYDSSLPSGCKSCADEGT